MALMAHVIGEGHVVRSPNEATVHFSVVLKRPAVAEASAAAAEVADTLQKTLVRTGATKITTSNLSIQPVFKSVHQPDGHWENVPDGFEYRNSVSVLLENVSGGEAVSRLIDSVLQGCGDALRMEHVSFGLSDTERRRALTEARRGAALDARGRAEVYAEALGLRVASLATISEQGPTAPLPPPGGGGPFPGPRGFGGEAQPMMAMMKLGGGPEGGAGDAVSTPVNPGEVGISAKVYATFALEAVQ